MPCQKIHCRVKHGKDEKPCGAGCHFGCVEDARKSPEEVAEKILENESLFSFPPQVVRATGITRSEEFEFVGKWCNKDLINEIAAAIASERAAAKSKLAGAWEEGQASANSKFLSILMLTAGREDLTGKQMWEKFKELYAQEVIKNPYL